MSERLSARLDGAGPRERRVIALVGRTLVDGGQFLENWFAEHPDQAHPTNRPRIELAKRLAWLLLHPETPPGPLLWQTCHDAGWRCVPALLDVPGGVVLEDLLNGGDLPAPEPGWDFFDYAKMLCSWLLEECESARLYCQHEKIRRHLKEAFDALDPVDRAQRAAAGEPTRMSAAADTFIQFVWAGKPLGTTVSRAWLCDDDDLRWPPPLNDDAPADLSELDTPDTDETG